MALRGSVRQQGIGMEGTFEVITSEREEREGDEEKERESVKGTRWPTQG